MDLMSVYQIVESRLEMWEKNAVVFWTALNASRENSEMLRLNFKKTY